MDDPRAFCLEERREQPDAVAIRTGNLVGGKRLRFRAHYHGPDVGRDLDDTVDPAGKIGRFGDHFATGFRNVFVPDPLFIQKLGQNHPVELRPPRARHASYIAKKFDAVLLQQLEKISERVASVADGMDREFSFRH